MRRGRPRKPMATNQNEPTPQTRRVPDNNPFEAPMASNEPKGEGASVYQDIEETQGAVTQERRPIAPGEATQKLFPGEIRDSVYLSPKDLRDMGMEGAIPSSLADTAKEGDRVYVCVRAPEHYGKVDPGGLRQKRLRWPSMEIPKDEQGQYHYATKDLIYATIDRKEYLASLGRHNKASEVFTRGLIEGVVEGTSSNPGLVETFRGGDQEFLNKKRTEAHATFNRGMKTKWPRNMTLAQIEQHMGDEETIRLEREAARGGRSERPGEYEEFARRMAEAGKKKKSVSLPGMPTAR